MCATVSRRTQSGKPEEPEAEAECSCMADRREQGEIRYRSPANPRRCRRPADPWTRKSDAQLALPRLLLRRLAFSAPLLGMDAARERARLSGSTSRSTKSHHPSPRSPLSPNPHRRRSQRPILTVMGAPIASREISVTSSHHCCCHHRNLAMI
jgi:hypothetical protein